MTHFKPKKKKKSGFMALRRPLQDEKKKRTKTKKN